FVSSHLMSEMALTADHLIVIGRGRLLADASTADVIAAGSRNYVLVRTPDPVRLAELLRQGGAAVTAGAHHPDSGEPPGLQVTGLDRPQIGDLAARHGIAVHELTPHTASLEAAYMALTHDHVDFHADPVRAHIASMTTATGLDS
ncbi:MAG: ABC transporter ATP-binding protein, partial [Actinomycetota bacterium]|nr:ABC transporter ATP-binding protein [Actinomycetota bacterium]